MNKDINEQQCRHYEAKLAFEIDSWDLWDGLRQGRTIIVVDTRSPESYAKERQGRDGHRVWLLSLTVGKA
jgi:hypothetical protein